MGSNDCCGWVSADTQKEPMDRPGYGLLGFVTGFIGTQAGPVPVVRTVLDRQDKLSTLLVRLGIGRDRYRVSPGLYAVGTPDDRSPVLVTANFKLSFDVVRKSINGVDAWILVVDTRNINVWCAAGKGTFSTEEVVIRVKMTELGKIVRHRRLILPQLAATGVNALHVKKNCGFEVAWGPVHASQIKAFLKNGMKATPDMRNVTFSLKERVELIPVELSNTGKTTLYLLPVLLFLSGLGKGFFSFGAAFSRGIPAFGAYVMALVAGAVVTPILLPRLPGSAFATKGAVAGGVAGLLFSIFMQDRLAVAELCALTLFIAAVSSFLSMNFTGSTPFTSPTGVEKEMRKAIPIQATVLLAAVVLWVGAGFVVG